MNARPRRNGAAGMNTKDDRMVGDFLYLYCITGTKPPLRPQGTVSDIHVVRGDGIYAVVGRASAGEFGEENLRRNLSDSEFLNPMPVSITAILTIFFPKP